MKKVKTKKDNTTVDEHKIKVCRICKRTIMEEDNKTGICESCAKDGKALGGLALLTASLAVVKKFGKPVVNFVANRFLK